MEHLTQAISELTRAIKDGHCQQQVLNALNRIEQKVNNMGNELDSLTNQVASNTSVVESAITLINGIAARITAAGADPAKLAALTASLKSEDDALAAAVAANTPAPAPPAT